MKKVELETPVTEIIMIVIHVWIGCDISEIFGLHEVEG